MEFTKGDKVRFSKKAIQGRFCDKFSNGKKTAEVEMVEPRKGANYNMVWLSTGKWIEDYYLQKIRASAKNIKNVEVPSQPVS